MLELQLTPQTTRREGCLIMLFCSPELTGLMRAPDWAQKTKGGMEKMGKTMFRVDVDKDFCEIGDDGELYWVRDDDTRAGGIITTVS